MLPSLPAQLQQKEKTIEPEVDPRPIITVKEFKVYHSWSKLLEKVLDYLNTYVRPHSLISLSAFEDSHNAWMFAEDQEEVRTTLIAYSAVVTHYGAGSTPIFDEQNSQLNEHVYGVKIFD